MYPAVEAKHRDEVERFCGLAGLAPVNADVLSRQRPDALWMLLRDAGDVAARCALWWLHTPPYPEQRLGLIGHYAVQAAAAAEALLTLACAQLAQHGCTLAVGPMDGNTWQRYRLLTQRSMEPPFFLEPDNPDDWPDHFTGNGFTPLAEYFSALNTDLEKTDPRIPETAANAASLGITLRPLDPGSFEEELRSVHALTLASFADNFLYTPIGADDFVAQYSGIQPYVRPELVLLAEQDRRPVGYVFAIPDMLQAKRGQVIDTVIVKTLAVHPNLGGHGLGGLLVARCQEEARKLGYTRAIHALMHEGNKSRRISSHTAAVIRRYKLFARSLRENS